MTKIALKYLEGLERCFCATFKIKKKKKKNLDLKDKIEKNSPFKENSHFFMAICMLEITFIVMDLPYHH